MKTNFDLDFKTDESLETDGIWIVYPNKAEIKIKRFGGSNSQTVRAIAAANFKPYSRQIEMGTLPQKKDREITITTFVKGCVVDWKNVFIDGVETPYSEETAIKLLIGLPELYEHLLKESQKMDNFKESLGNV